MITVFIRFDQKYVNSYISLVKDVLYITSNVNNKNY